ncbi:MAG: VWA domain-containing protein [Pseudomonadota bacterium]
MSRLCLSLVIAIVFVASPLSSGAQDQTQPRVMLVLDGSSSMWTRVDGEMSKIEVARDSIAELVGGWEDRMEFGITTYGHREEGNCEDIETVLPVAEVDSEKVVEVVNGILPRGKTPLAAALRQAAEALDYRNQPAKILLVSDGIENCGKDPCQMVRELVAEAEDLEIDVIGFDMNNHEMGQLECIAVNTAGHMVETDSSAFTETMDQSMTAAMAAEAPEARLALSTTLVNKPVTEDVRYVVYRHQESEPARKVAESMSANVTLNLPAGTYTIEALRGEGAGTLNKRTEIELAKGEELEVVFRLAEFRPPAR